MRTQTWISAVIALTFAGSLLAADRDAANYAGIKTCGVCHKKDESGNQLAKWEASAQLGPLYGSDRYHQYYYGVAPQFATAERPAYRAAAGYSGLVTGVSLRRRFKSFWVGAFVRYDALQGAVFEDSPLVKRSHYFAAGLAVSWIFAESKERVDVDD